MLWRFDEVTLFLITVVIFFGVIEAAYRLGMRHRDPDDDAQKTHIMALQSALLGLLALLLGFTFAMAVQRFDTRKSLVLEESNAIGKAYWRSQLAVPSQRPRVGRLLKEYARARVSFHDASGDDTQIEAASADAFRLEQQIWGAVGAVQAEDPHSTVTSLFIQSVNDMVDVNEKRRVALENHVPEPVLTLLFIVATGAIGFIAYGSGLAGRRRFVSTAIFATLIALVLTFIRDIDHPRTGVVQVSQESMIRLKDTLEKSAP